MSNSLHESHIPIDETIDLLPGVHDAYAARDDDGEGEFELKVLVLCLVLETTRSKTFSRVMMSGCTRTDPEAQVGSHSRFQGVQTAGSFRGDNTT